MSLIAVVGGHGRVAQQLHPQLVAAGHNPVALVRSEDQRTDLEVMGAEVRILDLEQADVAAYAAAFAGCAAVVFAAGGGADGDASRKRTVDLGASLKSADAAVLAGISRFVQVSAIGVDAPVAEDAEDSWRAYVEAKREADRALREGPLAWTIIRPGGLTDDPATGLVTLGGDEVERGQVSRADVAAVVVAVLDTPASVGHQLTLVGGSDPIADALSAAVAGSTV